MNAIIDAWIKRNYAHDVTFDLAPQLQLLIDAAIAQAVAAEREANCATICPKCAGKFDTYQREAVLVDGLWVHKSALDESIFSSVPCDAAAIRARSNGAGR